MAYFALLHNQEGFVACTVVCPFFTIDSSQLSNALYQAHSAANNVSYLDQSIALID